MQCGLDTMDESGVITVSEGACERHKQHYESSIHKCSIDFLVRSTGPIAVACRLSVCLSVCLSTPVTQQPMF